jgi:hypothetical protein
MDALTRLSPAKARQLIGNEFRRNGAPYSKPFFKGIHAGIESYCAGQPTVSCPYNERSVRGDAFMFGVLFARRILEQAEAAEAHKALRAERIEQKFGEAFSAVLLGVSEADLKLTLMLGRALIAELAKRGLTLTTVEHPHA